MRRSIIAVIPLALAAALVSPPSHAQVSAKAMAEALFQEGRDLMQKGDAAAACSKFEQSQHLEAKLGTLLNLATCHEQINRTASAWAEFTEAAEIAHREHEDKRADFANEHAHALEQKLSKIVLKRADASTALTIAIDGRQLDGALVGTPLPLDPGKHEVEARASGKKTWTGEVVVPAGPSQTDVAIPKLEDAAAAAPVAATPSAPPPAASSAPIAPVAAPVPAPEAPPSRGVPTLAYVGFGVAGAGLVAGAVTGILSLSKAGDLKSACKDGACPSDQADALSSATTLANVSNVAFALAAVGAAVGVVSIVLTPAPKHAPEKTATRVRVGTSGLGGSMTIDF